MLNCVRSAGLANTSAPSRPKMKGSHSSSPMARRVHSSAVSTPSQNSHCGVSGWRSRTASSTSSSASSVALVASSNSSLGVSSEGAWVGSVMAQFLRAMRGW